MARDQIYQFGEFKLHSRSRTLVDDNGSACRIAGTPYDLFVFLLQNAGREITNEELRQLRKSAGNSPTRECLNQDFTKLYSVLGRSRRRDYITRHDGSTWFKKTVEISVDESDLSRFDSCTAKIGSRDRTLVQESVAFPATVFAVSNIPIRVPIHFLGRNEALARIEDALLFNQGRVAITALHGLRGVGKTTLAAAYAEKHRGDYRATWWIRAQTETSIRADLVALGLRLGWVSPGDKQVAALPTVLERLRQEGEGILLIFDNAIDAKNLKDYLPRSAKVQVLITSNSHVWRKVAWPLQLQLWPTDIGADYLIARTDRTTERASAELLSEALGGLPLAHEQAAAYCERLSVSFSDYRHRFEAAPMRLLDDWRHAPAEYYDGLTVAKTFELAIQEAQKLHPAAEPLIVHAALLAPEPIPLFLLRKALGSFDETFAPIVEGEGFDEAVAALRVFALVDRETIVDEHDLAIATETIRLHRLVREVAAARRTGKDRDNISRALVKALITVYPGGGERSPETWPMSRRLDALAFALVTGGAVPSTGAAGLEIATLMDRIALYSYRVLTAFERARPLYERAASIREKILGPRHPETASSLNNLALLLMDQGDFATARSLLERALGIYEHASGLAHPETASVLDSLGRLCKDQGDFAGACPLYERALAIRETVLGPKDPQTALSLNNLALLLKDQGDFIGARPLLERALSIREEILGPDHPNTASSLNNLGLLVMSQGDFAQAGSLLERALTSYERNFGPDHPKTAASRNNLGWLHRQKGDFTAARPLLERALRTRERAFGPEHLYTTWSLNNLGLLLKDQGELAPSRSLLERALAIRERVLGSEHPDTATSMDSLAQVLIEMGNSVEGRLLFKRALLIREKLLGAKHPDTVASYQNLAASVEPGVSSL